MSGFASKRLELGDAELITAVRAGDNSAYGPLFERHRSAALKLARQLLPGAESEDLVSEAFTKVFVQLQDGRGPDLAFRAYLLTAVRNLHIDRIRSTKRVHTTADETELDKPVEFFDLAALNFERGTTADAFASLPERWQLVLWHLDVEGQKPTDVALLLGMSANSVSALAYRAREGLRQAYLQHHLADSATGNCHWTTERLGAHVRKGLANRDAARVEGHLDECRRCMGIYLELVEVNTHLSGVLAPAILGTAAAGYLAAGATGATATLGAAIGFKAMASAGAKAVLEPVKSVVAGAGIQGAAAVAVVGALAFTGIYASTGGFGQNDNMTIKSPVATSPATQTPTPTAEPAEQATTEPTVAPSAAAPVEPLVAPLAKPTAGPDANPFPKVVTPAVPSTDPPSDPPPPAVIPTDLGIGAITNSNDSVLLQRQISIPVSSTANGDSTKLDLTMTITFNHRVRFLGAIGPSWNCTSLDRRYRVNSLTCIRSQSGSAVPNLVFTVRSILPTGMVAIGAKGNADPNPANNSTSFRAKPWLLIL